MNRRKLQRILRRAINESIGLNNELEEFIVQQYEHSTRTMGTGFEIEMPNEAHIIEAVAELLSVRYGIQRGEYMEEPDGEFMIFYSPEL